MTPPRYNPCRSISRYKETRRERFLAPEEYRELGVYSTRPKPTARCSLPPSRRSACCLRAAAKDEIVTLKRDDVDRTAGELRLSDGETACSNAITIPHEFL